MKLLVTGGAGFIGSHFVDLALSSRPEWEVTVLDALTYAGDVRNLDRARQHHGFRFVEGDVAGGPATERLLGQVDQVVNFAAESSVDRSIRDSEGFVRTNVEGTRALLDACRVQGVPLLQVSTDEVYGSTAGGEATDEAFTEDDPLRPGNPYAATKAAADLLCTACHRTFGMDVRILRGANAFGPRQHREKAIPTFAVAALRGDPVPVYGDGSHRRAWLAVDDFVRAAMTVIDEGQSGEIYNAGGGTEIANLDLARTICRLAGADDSLIGFVDDRPGHDFRYAMDWTRIAALGWKPEADFHETLAITVAWYREHPERWG